MTDGQKESFFMTYVSACNGLLYAEDLVKDKSLHPRIRQDVSLISNKFKWIKSSLEARTDGSILRTIDTLRYDEILRLMMNLDEENQHKLEMLISKFVDDLNPDNEGSK